MRTGGLVWPSQGRGCSGARAQPVDSFGIACYLLICLLGVGFWALILGGRSPCYAFRALPGHGSLVVSF